MTRDLKLPGGVELISSEDERVAWIQPPREEIEPVITEDSQESEDDETEQDTSDTTEDENSTQQES